MNVSTWLASPVHIIIISLGVDFFIKAPKVFPLMSADLTDMPVVISQYFNPGL